MLEKLKQLAKEVSNENATFFVHWDTDGCYFISVQQKLATTERVFGEAEYAELFLRTHGNATSHQFPGASIVGSDNSAIVEPPEGESEEWVSNFKHIWNHPLNVSDLNPALHQTFCLRANHHTSAKAFFSSLNTAAILATVKTRKEKESV